MTARRSPIRLSWFVFTIVFGLGAAGLVAAGILTGSTLDATVAPEQTIATASYHASAPLPAWNGMTFPDLIPLPNGFAPEGITVGRGSTFFVGSLADGSIYKGDLQTGAGELLVDSPDERIAVGLAYDQRSDMLFVAGQTSGAAYVYDATTGEEAAMYQLTDPVGDNFINDVIVTPTAAYFTDSFRPFIYRVPLGSAGELPDAGDVEDIELGDGFQFAQGSFNTNGIEASPNGEHLIIVNSTAGALYRVDPETGDAQEIDLGGENVSAGDGLWLDGRMLFVVRNQLNQIAVVELTPDFTSGEISRTITSDDFDIPTTAAGFGNDLYVVNARFGTEVTPDTEYNVVRVSKR